MFWLVFIVEVLILLFQIELGDSRLVYLQYIFRHGARAPTSTYPGDLIPAEYWPQGYGELTQLGKKQHYELGKLIQNMYKGFITSNPNEVFLNSTDLDRCFQSGLSHVAALYAPDTKWTFEDVNWQPIPIHYFPAKTDRYLGFYSDCPEASKISQHVFQTPELKQTFEEKYKPILRALSQYIGHVPQPMEAYNLYDAWHVEKSLNLPLPYWVPRFYKQLEEFTKLAFNYMAGSPLIQRLRIGPLTGKMIENMRKKLAGEIPTQKVQVYSAQEEQIQTLLNALGVYNNLPVNYCATVLLELHVLSDRSPAVRLLYLNSTMPENGFQEPYVLTLKGCSEYCPLHFFVNHAKDFIPHDGEQECGLKK